MELSRGFVPRSRVAAFGFAGGGTFLEKGPSPAKPSPKTLYRVIFFFDIANPQAPRQSLIQCHPEPQAKDLQKPCNRQADARKKKKDFLYKVFQRRGRGGTCVKISK